MPRCATCGAPARADALVRKSTGRVYCDRACATAPIGATTLGAGTGVRTADEGIVISYQESASQSIRELVVAFMANVDPRTDFVTFPGDSTTTATDFPEYDNLQQKLVATLSSKSLTAAEEIRVLGALAARWYSVVDINYRMIGLAVADNVGKRPITGGWAGPRTLFNDPMAAVYLVQGVIDSAISAQDEILAVTTALLKRPALWSAERTGLLRALVYAVTQRSPTPTSIVILRELFLHPNQVLGRTVLPGEQFGHVPGDIDQLRTTMMFQVREYALRMRRINRTADPTATPVAMAAAFTALITELTNILAVYNSWVILVRHGHIVETPAECVRMLREIAMAFIDPIAAGSLPADSPESHAALRHLLVEILRTYPGSIEPYLANEVRAIGEIDFDDFFELYALIAMLRSRQFRTAYEQVRLMKLNETALITLCLNTHHGLLGMPTPVLAGGDYVAMLTSENTDRSARCLLSVLLDTADGAALRNTNFLTRLNLTQVMSVIDPTSGHQDEDVTVPLDPERHESDSYMPEYSHTKTLRGKTAGVPMIDPAQGAGMLEWASLEKRARSTTASPVVPSSSSSSAATALSSTSRSRKRDVSPTAMDRPSAPQVRQETMADRTIRTIPRSRVTAAPSSTPSAYQLPSSSTTSLATTPVYPPASSSSLSTTTAAAAAAGSVSSYPMESSAAPLTYPTNTRIGVAITDSKRKRMSGDISIITPTVGLLRFLRVYAALGVDRPHNPIGHDGMARLLQMAMALGGQNVYVYPLLAIRALLGQQTTVSDATAPGSFTGLGTKMAQRAQPEWLIAHLLDCVLLALADAKTELAAAQIADEFFEEYAHANNAPIRIASLFRMTPTLSGLVSIPLVNLGGAAFGTGDQPRTRFTNNLSVTLGSILGKFINNPTRYLAPRADVTKFRALIMHSLFAQIIERVPYSANIADIAAYLPQGNIAANIANAVAVGLGIKPFIDVYEPVSAIYAALTQDRPNAAIIAKEMAVLSTIAYRDPYQPPSAP